MLVFDIETGPLHDEQLRALMPEFDAGSIKTGNLKDPEKIRAKIEQAKADHEQAFIDSAALSPLTGRVLAIGFLATESDAHAILEGDEPAMLADFWRKYDSVRADRCRVMVGHNIFGFDVPFLIRRSWLTGVEPPMAKLFPNGPRYLDSFTFVDTMQRWACGDYKCWTKLDALATAFTGQGKPEGVTGADFSRLYHGTAEEKKQALDYLKNDLKMTASVAARMGVI